MFETSLLRTLKEDHSALEQRVMDLRDLHDPAAVDRLRREIAVTWRVHCLIEEEVLFKALEGRFQETRGPVFLDRARQEHQVIDRFLHDLLLTRPSSDRFPRVLETLTDALFTHAGDEEQALYPRAKRLIGRETMERLSAKAMDRRVELFVEVEQEILAEIR